jgi:chorismate dehydratase
MTDDVFSISVDSASQNAIKMREHDLDGALLTPVDYARESSEYRIIPDIAVSSRSPNSTIVLDFNKGMRTIRTLAVHPTSTSEVVLASIILSEQFDVRPKILPMVGTFDEMLRSADAALLVGDDALVQGSRHPNRLDLVEEWMDMTDLPYVHGFWCVRGEGFTRNDVAQLQQARQQGNESLARFAQSEATRFPRNTVHELEEYLKSLSFTLSEQEQQGLNEFLRYAYYLGTLPDVPDLNFFAPDDEDNKLFSNSSMN